MLKTAIERHDFDCTQMALNSAMVGMKSSAGGMVPNEAMRPSFETVALPVAPQEGGRTCDEGIRAGCARDPGHPGKLLYYSLSLPVTAAVVCMPKFEHIEENVQLAKRFAPLPKSESARISGTLSQKNKAKLDLFLSKHVDAPSSDSFFVINNVFQIGS